MANTKKGRVVMDKAKTTKATEKTVDTFRQITSNTPPEVVNSYKQLIIKFGKGLPVASSGEVLNRRVRW